MTALVFDVGGTRTRAALWNTETQHLERRVDGPSPRRFATDERDEPLVPELIDQLRALGDRVLAGSGPPGAVGVAFPGPVSPTGHVARAPTLWGPHVATAVPLVELVQARLWDRPTRVVNDLTAAGYRYARPGADFCVVTVSSGIGNKVFLDGRPVLGASCAGGEIGHWRVDPAPDAPRCECGGRGHLGAVASGRATAHHVAEVRATDPQLFAASCLRTTDNVALAAAFRSGDAFARAVVRRGARALGAALALLHVGLGLERFIILGGWARALGPQYLTELAQAAAERAWGAPQDWLGRIEPGAGDDDSGLIGLGRLLDQEAPAR